MSHPLAPALSALNDAQQRFQYVPFHLGEAAALLARAGEHERARECERLGGECLAFLRFWWEDVRPQLVAVAFPEAGACLAPEHFRHPPEIEDAPPPPKPPAPPRPTRKRKVIP